MSDSFVAAATSRAADHAMRTPSLADRLHQRTAAFCDNNNNLDMARLEEREQRADYESADLQHKLDMLQTRATSLCNTGLHMIHVEQRVAAMQISSDSQNDGGADDDDHLEVSDSLLGEGATAQVWYGTFGTPPAAVPVAVKIVQKQGLDADELGWIREEMRLHQTLAHPHVCRMYTAFEAAETFTMVLQLCRGGSLVDTMGRALDEGEPLSESVVHSAFVQLVGALEYCHRHGIAHRDIKLDNLCWQDEEESHLLLIDFGYASTRDAHAAFSGSAHYASPEVHRTVEVDTAAGERPQQFSARRADVWSCGVCLFAMLATALPFNGAEETEEERRALRQKIYKGVPDVPSGGQVNCSPLAVDLLDCMLHVDATERASIDEVIAHEWVGGLSRVPWQGEGEGEFEEIALGDEP